MPLTVMFEVFDGGTEHLRDVSTGSPITIDQSGVAEIDISTNVIAGVVEHGKVSIAVIESSDQQYSIGNNGQLNVGIADQVVPEVSISTSLDPQSVIEGESFSVILETNPHPLNFVDVTLLVDDLGLEYFQEFAVANPIRIGPNGLQEVEVRTNVVHTNLDDSQLSISISEDSGGNYAVSSTLSSINVEIRNKMPEISISVKNEITSVVEGSSFDVVLTAVPAPVTPLSVVLVAEDTGTGHLGELSTTNPVSIGTDGVTSITVDSNINTAEISQGQIVLTVLEGANYTVSEDENLVTVKVKDENLPLLPEVSITTSRSTVQVGESAEFMFNLDLEPDSNIRVDLAVSVSGNINLWRVPKYISVGRTGSLSLNILNSSDLDEPGSITVQILSSPDYISTRNIAVITVEPNESNDASDDARISVADAVVKSLLATLLQGSQTRTEEGSSSPEYPVVSIRAVTNSINEGQTAQFQIFATAPVVGEINLNVSQQGNFLTENPPVKVAMNGTQTVNLDLETHDDSIAELDGTIQVMILAGENYSISSSQNTAIVNVIDATDRELYRSNVMTGLNTVLPQMMQASNAGVYQKTSDRLNLGLLENSDYLKLGGANTIKDWLKVTGRLVNEKEMLTQMLLDNSSFAFDLTPGLIPNRSITAWGSSEFQSLKSASNSETDWSGELYSGYLGLDTNLTPEIVLGVGVSTIEGNFDFDVSSAEQLNFMSSSNSIYPYFGWKSSQNDSEFQATIGFGNGEVLINHSDRETDKLHSQHTSISLGGKIDIASNFEGLESRGINLAVQGSTLNSQQKLLDKNLYLKILRSVLINMILQSLE